MCVFTNRNKNILADSLSPDYFVGILDERGRIIVPAFIRKRLSLKFGSNILVSVEAAQDSDSKVSKKQKRGGKYE